MDVQQSWYVIHCKPRKESQVHRQLQAKSIDVFYPTVRVKPVNPRAAKIRPYFPGYLFVHVNLAAVGIGALQWIPGVNRMVQFDGQPSPISDQFIRALKDCVAILNKTGPVDLSSIKKGDWVRIKDGPFAGHEAIFDMRLSANHRIRVLLELAGRLVRVDIDSHNITPVARHREL